MIPNADVVPSRPWVIVEYAPSNEFLAAFTRITAGIICVYCQPHPTPFASVATVAAG